VFGTVHTPSDNRPSQEFPRDDPSAQQTPKLPHPPAAATTSPMRLRFATILALLALQLGPGLAAAQVETVSIEDFRRLHPTVTQDLLESLGATLSAASFDVRTQTDLGPRFRPRFLPGDGVAVHVVLPDGQARLVTPWIWVAPSATIEVRVGETWVPATLAHASALFDLAVLEVGPLDAPALPLAPAPVIGGIGFHCGPAQPAPAPACIAIAGALGDHGTEEGEFYRVSTFTTRNGYPIADATGALVGVTSIADPAARGGSWVVDADAIRAWFDEWPRITDASPAGIAPRIVPGALDLTTGRDAVRGGAP
jgi:hypothetical protein